MRRRGGGSSGGGGGMLVRILLIASFASNIVLLVLLQSFGGSHTSTAASSASHTAEVNMGNMKRRFAEQEQQLHELQENKGCPVCPVCKACPACPAQAPCPPSALPASPTLLPLPTPRAPAAVSPASHATVNPILRHLGGHNADSLWEALLKAHPKPREAVVMEVGAHDGNQALEAGRLGFQVVTYEPSPQSAEGIRRNFARNGSPKNVKLIEAAATNFTGKILINAVGSTGDHIGVNSGEINKDYMTNKHTEVEAVRVDDAVMAMEKGVYIVKIDVQGHEPFVIDGMRRALAEHRVLYVILEYWPRAMRITGKREGWEPLKVLAENGYTIFDTKVHHRRKRRARKGFSTPTQPLDDFMRPAGLKAASDWYHKMDEDYMDEFGCKTDMLAVAPAADIEFF